jgi:hypothetical protein
MVPRDGSTSTLARAWAERARGERTRAHAEARAEGRRHGTEKVAAAGAAAVVADDGAGYVCAEPVTAGFAQRIDTLHGETGQVLHQDSLSGPLLFAARQAARRIAPLAGPQKRNERNDGGILPRGSCGVKQKGYKM